MENLGYDLGCGPQIAPHLKEYSVVPTPFSFKVHVPYNPFPVPGILGRKSRTFWPLLTLKIRVLNIRGGSFCGYPAGRRVRGADNIKRGA